MPRELPLKENSIFCWFLKTARVNAMFLRPTPIYYVIKWLVLLPFYIPLSVSIHGFAFPGCRCRVINSLTSGPSMRTWTLDNEVLDMEWASATGSLYHSRRYGVEWSLRSSTALALCAKLCFRITKNTYLKLKYLNDNFIDWREGLLVWIGVLKIFSSHQINP